MATRTIKLNLENVKLEPGMRYMTNVTLAGKKGYPVFPYSQERMDKNSDLREVYPVIKGAALSKVAEEPVAQQEPEFTTEEPVEIEQPVIDLSQTPAPADPEPEKERELSPIEKARAARAAKRAQG